MNKTKKRFFLILVTLFGLTLFASNVSTEPFKKTNFQFSSNENILSGKLVTPKKIESNTLLVFVHGDGEMPYDAYGFYKPYWRHLARAGIASLSWSKPGVGKSEGNWLSQDMNARALEVIDAISAVKKQHPQKFKYVGVIGFSQGGWVLPKINDPKQPVDFYIFASTAINWMDQGQYMRRRSLENEGKDEDAIVAALQNRRKQSEKAFAADANYQTFIEVYGKDTGISEQRYQFIKKNWRSDATEELKALKQAVLVLHGDHDLNVDGPKNSERYATIFKEANHPAARIELFANATHQLTLKKYFNTPNPGVLELMKLEWHGESAFAPGVLDTVSSWIHGVTKEQH